MDRISAAAALTLVAAVLELGIVVVLVSDDDGDLADADERLLGLVRRCDRQAVLSLALSVKGHGCADHTLSARSEGHTFSKPF